MADGKYHFTSESVTEGHPDKVCDQISDGILDALIKDDPMCRVAAETMVKTGMVIITGEITTKSYVNIPKLVRSIIKDIGYTKPEYGFDYQSCAVITAIDEQSPDIAQGVDPGGAGDQGMMSGFATNETPELMPLTAILAHRLTQKLAAVRKDGSCPYLRPDGKSQATVRYDNGKPLDLSSVVLAAQHDPEIGNDRIISDLKEFVINPVCADYLTDATKILINNTGRFVIGGPVADAGMTGRKVIVDTYGGVGGHGGGAFSGKDPTKVDRSGSYMSRHVAKNIVAAGLADKCELQISYVIGGKAPLGLMIDTFRTNKVPLEKIYEVVTNNFSFAPADIIKYLNLRRPIFRKTAAYGHFGRTDPDFTWERTNMAAKLKSEAGL